jgi:hypothetical protein
MIFYEVTLQVEPDLAAKVDEYLRRRHIPDIFATGCFRRIRLDGTSPARFRTCYQAESPADVDRYLREHAPRLRAEFQAHFPTGVTLTRETWTERATWE